MIIYIAFGIVISVSIALIAMGLIEIDAEKKRETLNKTLSDKPMTLKELQDYLGVKMHCDSRPLEPNAEVTMPDGTIIRVGGVHMEGEANEQ